MYIYGIIKKGVFMYNKLAFKNDIKDLGLKKEDVLMIHSSYSSIKNIDGGANSILSVLKEEFKDGCVMLPAHTWNSINEDNMICDLQEANSCVGYLTNMAILDKDFIRSNHPTHSVVAYGKKATDWIKDDINSKTPVSPNGSFGKLKNGGYILFIGCPLSKNTFIHSIEEYYDVKDRFTNHIYTFYTKNNDIVTEFHMPRHYNLKCPHISLNYEKLLPIMLEKGIAKRVKILDSESYLINAYECFLLVSEILKNDIHAFDDMRDINL